jgi:hypothetical protein
MQMTAKSSAKSSSCPSGGSGGSCCPSGGGGGSSCPPSTGPVSNQQSQQMLVNIPGGAPVSPGAVAVPPSSVLAPPGSVLAPPSSGTGTGPGSTGSAPILLPAPGSPGGLSPGIDLIDISCLKHITHLIYGHGQIEQPLLTFSPKQVHRCRQDSRHHRQPVGHCPDQAD